MYIVRWVPPKYDTKITQFLKFSTAQPSLYSYLTLIAEKSQSRSEFFLCREVFKVPSRKVAFSQLGMAGIYSEDKNALCIIVKPVTQSVLECDFFYLTIMILLFFKIPLFSSCSQDYPDTFKIGHIVKCCIL